MHLRRILSAVAAGSLTLGLLITVPAAASGTASTYVILYSAASVPADAGTVISAAGGTLVARYDAIGVAIATSSEDGFQAAISADTRVEAASSTQGFGVRLDDEVEVADASDLLTAGTWGDPLSGNQWDMVQIHVPEAYDAGATGSPSVVVGDIDTGLDYTHPDLAANVDFSKSVSCVSGVPNQDPSAWNDDNGHGTHTAGTIAAAANGIGIVGVAPNVRIAGIKAGNRDGYFFPEAVICSFIWAADHHIDVTNNSYYADPWLFNCRNDPEQRAIWKAEQRAIRYAMQKGVTVVAAQGNENKDLSKQNVDTTSPDDSTPVTRDVTNACAVIPVEIPGVVGVTANGNLMQKSYYSSYGVGVAQVVAPGGDSRFQRTPAATRGTVLSTYPGNRYAYAQGTSMASPHVAGVAALIKSRYPNLPPGGVAARITATADPIACPPDPFDPGPPYNYAATCEGGGGYNGFYGHGQVNAFSAAE
jgi:subtilisin family serine protease